jgi:sarcosine oxidase
VTRDADVVVVGAGIQGSATAWALARRGRAVVLLEQFELGHKHGSSHGGSRIFRLSYPDERYVRLAQEALVGWRTLEADAGEELIVRSGALDLGAHALENARALAACGVQHEQLTGAEVRARWELAAEPDEPALFQPDGGHTRADRAHAALLEGARTAGADVRERARVTALAPGADEVSLGTDDGELRARGVVVTAGAWARGLLAPLGIDLPVTVTRETVAYFALDGAASLPTLIDATGTNGAHAYGLAAPGVGLKAGVHRSGPVVDPDEPGEAEDHITARTSDWVARRYPDADATPLFAETCLYTTTPDESFVLERHGRVIVGSACSGHGFKFAPAIGERLAALALDAPD